MTTNQGTLRFVKTLSWLFIELHGSKISFYRNIVFQNVFVNKALVEYPCAKLVE